jgi:hypothetical protein
MGFLASPRRRRRLAKAGIAAGLVGLVATAVVVLPEGKPLAPERLRPAPKVKEEREVPLTPAMRAEINATLRRFVPAALSRERPAVAWGLAGPGLRAGSTKRDWLRGDFPVHPYPWRQQRLDGWRLVYAYRDKVAIDLLVQPPKRARVGPIVFGVDLIRRDQRWLVNSMYPAAVFSGPNEKPWVVGAADFRAGSATAKSFYEREPDRARLSAAWIAVPGALFAAVLLIPIALVLRSIVADRRLRARYQGSRDRELPPLPRRG